MIADAKELMVDEAFIGFVLLQTLTPWLGAGCGDAMNWVGFLKIIWLRGCTKDKICCCGLM